MGNEKPGESERAVNRKQGKLEASLVGISERTRAMCLGSLVVIWGMFSQKEARISPSVREAHWLLGVAVAMVVVLALDMLELLFGIQEMRKELDVDMKFKNRPYMAYERWCRRGKVVIGLGGLVTLCVVLLLVLVQTGTAEGISEFHGKWCGGNAGLEQDICLKFVAPEGTLTVKYNRHDQADWITCVGADVVDARLLTSCDGISFVISEPQNYEMHTVANYGSGTAIERDLTPEPPRQ
jgi:uncharacterized membrane protein